MKSIFFIKKLWIKAMTMSKGIVLIKYKILMDQVISLINEDYNC